MVYLYYTLILITFVSVLQSRRKTSFSQVLLLIIVFCIFAFSKNISDQVSYAAFYDNNSFSNIQYINYNESSILFSLFAATAKAIGLDFLGFRIILFAISCLVCILVYRRCTSLGMLLVAFSAIPLFFDMIQIRFFCAEVVLIVALSALSNGKKLVYIMLVLLASLFHSMIIVLLIFAILPQKQVIVKDKTKQGLLVILVLLFSFMGRNVLPLISSFVLNFGVFDEYSGYMTMTVRNGFLLYFSYQLLNIVLANRIHKEFMDKNDVPEWNVKFDIINNNIQLVGLIFVVFTLININFCRYFRLFMIINSIDLSSLYYVNRSMGAKRDYRIKASYSALLFLVVLIVWLLGESFINHSFINIISEFFELS